MADSTHHPSVTGRTEPFGGHQKLSPGPHNAAAVVGEHDLLNRREASRAPSERSTNFDISEHDFLSVRGPPSQRSMMGTDTNMTGRGGGGGPRNKHTRRKLILCFDGTGNKFHGDDSDSNILKIFRMLDRTANDQCTWRFSLRTHVSMVQS